MSSPLLAPGTSDLLVDAVFPDERRWEPKDRPKLEPHQLPPLEFLEHKYSLWLLEAGRGAGKTEACARYVTDYMRKHPGHRGRIIAPTFGDAVEACVIGPSGLKAIDPDGVHWLPSAPGGAKVSWTNGSSMLVIGTPFPKDVDRLRAGGNRHLDWWEEMAANAQLGPAWDQAAFGLRLGDHPHAVASTTPRSVEAYKAIRDMDETIRINASMFDNPYNPKSFIELMRKKYEGTRLGRQELYGELLEDIEGALWTRFILERVRVAEAPELSIVVVAIDPAASSGVEASDTGIIVVGLGVDGKGYVLDDRTCHMGPDGWGKRAVRGYKKWSADYIVGEVNNGGEMVEHVIATIDPRVPFKSVHASRGKQTRAQPVATLYGDGKKRPTAVHHVGAFMELEDQLCTWVPEEEKSPDRLDALVWGLTELFFEEQEDESVVEYYDPVKIGADI